MKKILGLIASRRKLGNSELLVKELLSNVAEDCAIELIRLTDLKLDPCQACYRCLPSDGVCPLPDDFNFVLHKIKEADALVIGMPVYMLGPHGSYKMLTDRFVGAENYAEHTKGKPCVIVMPYGTKHWEGYSKASSLVLPRILKMKIVDCWQPHVTLPGEGLLDPAIKDYAQGLGRDLFGPRAYCPGDRACSCCGSDLVRLLPGNGVECAICGARGVISADNVIDFTGTPYYRFGEKEMEEHFKGFLVDMKQKFLTERDRLKEVQKEYRDLDWWVTPSHQ
ncbi:MAG: flavodoxin family protein [Peptococcaceae bacterium]|nr:flavodoxin family protein [Peptococcaceae bacterium]